MNKIYGFQVFLCFVITLGLGAMIAILELELGLRLFYIAMGVVVLCSLIVFFTIKGEDVNE